VQTANEPRMLLGVDEMEEDWEGTGAECDDMRQLKVKREAGARRKGTTSTAQRSDDAERAWQRQTGRMLMIREPRRRKENDEAGAKRNSRQRRKSLDNSQKQPVQYDTCRFSTVAVEAREEKSREGELRQ